MGLRMPQYSVVHALLVILIVSGPGCLSALSHMERSVSLIPGKRMVLTDTQNFSVGRINNVGMYTKCATNFYPP